MKIYVDERDLRTPKSSSLDVDRQVTRHGGRPAYRAYEANEPSPLRPKNGRLAMNHKLRNMVAGKLIPGLVARAGFRVAEDPVSR